MINSKRKKNKNRTNPATLTADQTSSKAEPTLVVDDLETSDASLAYDTFVFNDMPPVETSSTRLTNTTITPLTDTNVVESIDETIIESSVALDNFNFDGIQHAEPYKSPALFHIDTSQAVVKNADISTTSAPHSATVIENDTIDSILANSVFTTASSDNNDIIDGHPLTFDESTEAFDALVVETAPVDTLHDIEETTRSEVDEAVLEHLESSDIDTPQNLSNDNTSPELDETAITTDLNETLLTHSKAIITDTDAIAENSNEAVVAFDKHVDELAEDLKQQPMLVETLENPADIKITANSEVDDDWYDTDDKPHDHAATPNTAAEGLMTLAQFKTEQDVMNDYIADVDNKAKKTTALAYVSLSVSVVVLLATAALGFMVTRTQPELDKLTETVNNLKRENGFDMRKIAAANKDYQPAIDQLNQKIDGVIAQLNQPAALSANTEQTAQKPTMLTAPIAEDNPRVSALKAAALNEAKAVNAPTDKKTSPIVTKPNDAPALSTATKSSTDSTQKPIEKTATKIEDDKKPETLKKIEVVSEKPIKTVIISKVPVTKTEHRQARSNYHRYEKQRSQKTDNTDKKSLDLNYTDVKPPYADKSKSTGSFSVNLASSDKQQVAKQKAAELKQQGIPVEVIPVTVNNKQWYRLQVGGFKNRQEAADYAKDAEKRLNLQSVWVK